MSQKSYRLLFYMHGACIRVIIKNNAAACVADPCALTFEHVPNANTETQR